MGIVDKKTGKPIGTNDLAKKVEEYNRKFLASQEISVESPSAARIATTATPHPQRETKLPAMSSPVDAFSKQTIEAAKITVTKFVLKMMDKGPMQTLAAQGFVGAEPTNLMVDAAAHWFSIVNQRATNPEYTNTNAQADLEALKVFVKKNYISAPYITAMLQEYPFYIMALTSEHIISSGAMPKEAMLAFIERYISPLLDNLHKYIESLTSQDHEHNVSNYIKQKPANIDSISDIPADLIESAKKEVSVFVLKVLANSEVKNLILAGFDGKEPSEEMQIAAARCLKIIMSKITNSSYDTASMQDDMQRLQSYVSRQKSSPPSLLLLLTEFPEYAMGSALAFLVKHKGLSPDQASNYIQDELFPIFSQLTGFLHDLAKQHARPIS